MFRIIDFIEHLDSLLGLFNSQEYLFMQDIMYFFAVFEPYKDNKVDLLGPKLLFIALNLGGLALGVWKVRPVLSPYVLNGLRLFFLIIKMGCPYSKRHSENQFL